MGDQDPVDFRQWLCAELERERVRSVLTPAWGSIRETIHLSEQEATALLFLALDVEHHPRSDRLTSALADRLAEALYSRLLLIVEPSSSAFDAPNIQTSDHQGEPQSDPNREHL